MERMELNLKESSHGSSEKQSYRKWHNLNEDPGFRTLEPMTQHPEQDPRLQHVGSRTYNAGSTISHINYWDQVNTWKNFWKFRNSLLWRCKSGPSPLLNSTAYWKSSNTRACAKKLSQILAKTIDNKEKGLVSEFMWGIVSFGTPGLITL